MQGTLTTAKDVHDTTITYILLKLVYLYHRIIGHCRQCRELDNKARGREDFTLYRAMIKSIRHSEEAYKDDSYIIFLFQVKELDRSEQIIQTPHAKLTLLPSHLRNPTCATWLRTFGVVRVP